MGFSISWIGFGTLGLADVLKRTGFRDLGIESAALESEFSAAVLPTGWTILFANDFSFANSRRLRCLSSNTLIVACQIEEHVMYSAAHCVADGRERWRVCHDSQNGRYDLSISGTPPVQFERIKARLHAEQIKEAPALLMTDHYFDIPVELARNLTGYRHDRWRFDWGEPRFSELVRPSTD